MKVTYYVQERRSGKTTDLTDLYLKSYCHTYYFTQHPNYVQRLIPRTHHARVLSFDSTVVGCKIERLIIDDYDLIKDKNNFWYKLFPSLTPNADIVIKTTPDQKFKRTNYYTAMFLCSPRIYDIRRELSADDFNEVMKIKDSIFFKPYTTIINQDLLFHD